MNLDAIISSKNSPKPAITNIPEKDKTLLNVGHQNCLQEACPSSIPQSDYVEQSLGKDGVRKKAKQTGV